MRRYYVTVHGGGDGALFPANAGNILREQALFNLRRLRIASGFDYTGLEVRGTPVNGVPHLDLAWVGQRAPAGTVPGTRIIVSAEPIADVADDPGYELVVTIRRGEDFSWRGGMTTLAADICVSGADASLQLSAVILDVFTELMLANCASIQAVLSNYLADGGSQDTFYRAKADFASELIARGDAATLFEQYLPDRYACFATLAREDFLATMDEDEMASLASLWSQFLRERFSAYFLSVDQAVALVRNEPFHRARPELTVGSGVRPGGRMRYGFVDEAELRCVLSDKQVVLGTGAYVLCLLTGKPSDAEIGKIGNSFGWRRQADSVPKRLRLCTEDNYHEMIPFVRKGLVTPVRLFLKAS